MVAWSAFGRSFGINLLKNHVNSPLKVQNVLFSTTKIINAEHRTMAIQPSRWQYIKFKDMFHLYTMIGLIPVTIIIFCTNVFIGPAQLSVIPEGYVPKHWEYHRHPITRFIARYLHCPPQQDYEKFMHFLDEENQKAKLRELEKKVTALMAEYKDYKAYYYKPVVNKYLRINKKVGEELYERLGDNYDE